MQISHGRYERCPELPAQLSAQVSDRFDDLHREEGRLSMEGIAESAIFRNCVLAQGRHRNARLVHKPHLRPQFRVGR